MKKIEHKQEKTYRIALDAMGGDFAPANELEGVRQFFEESPLAKDTEVVLVGDEEKIKAALSQMDTSKMNYSILHASETITMHDEASAALKRKRDSSLYKGLELHSNGGSDAFVSSGNTGAMLSTATVLLGRINGVHRPTIGSFFPTKHKYPTLVLDVGANVEAKPRFLYQFAVMGGIYVTQVLGLENPRIGLLNIGEEPSKGSAVAQETHQMLSASQMNFIGNIEGRDILGGAADVVVCDGFTGNIILKFAESFLGFLKSKIKAYAKKGLFRKAMVAIIAPVLRKIFKEFDYQEYGGVPFLGVNGVVIVGHGSSTPKAIKNMIVRSVELVKKNVNQKIELALNPPLVSKNNMSGNI
ncbi:MAG: phosphate acyltransferase PlsX [Candidatus Kapaibacterium sp.]